MNDRLPLNELNSEEYDQFLVLLHSNKRRIFGFIFAAVPYYSTAEDIMQDTIIRLWSKFSDFTPGTDFAAWAITFARYVVMEYQKKSRFTHVRFDSQALENISEPFICYEDSDDRIEALRGCMEKLPKTHQHFLRMRYADKLTIKEVALKAGRPIHGMYKLMIKIQYSLQECIEKALRKWETT